MTLDELLAEIKPAIEEAVKISLLHHNPCSWEDFDTPHKCMRYSSNIMLPIPANLFEENDALWEQVLAGVTAWKWVASASEYIQTTDEGITREFLVGMQDMRILNVVYKPLKDITFED
jgi:hypothetical protein